MATKNAGTIRKATNEGDRALRRTGRKFGEDFRELRLRFGVTQAAVARSIGVSRSVICQLEAGDEDVGPRIRARASAALGATFKMAVYADAEPMIRDAAHARLIETLLRLRHPGWRVTIEAPVPATPAGPGHRSTDVRMDGARQIVLFEVESRNPALGGARTRVSRQAGGRPGVGSGRRPGPCRARPSADPQESRGHSLLVEDRSSRVPRRQSGAPRRPHEPARTVARSRDPVAPAGRPSDAAGVTTRDR